MLMWTSGVKITATYTNCVIAQLVVADIVTR